MELSMGLASTPTHQQVKNTKDNGKMIYGMEKAPILLAIQMKLEL